ncbi:hypothetical protein TCAL_00593 [Tigriopus californicus]|uniref:BHLH domain-containing protein n=1 Tax=Tigriopus californicus TaxID=6832 RepID=A0A553PA90_TIGCA|nr:uncharacterized protein LOC131893144 isoform X1 [Tigriopus californicus]TRY74601.1 hypothetical protein TCAL_00593 [Tigriopus californicus]
MTCEDRVESKTLRDRKTRKRCHTKASRGNPPSDHMHQEPLDRELRLLQSLIPDISTKQEMSELQIIDASVSYIEHLQSQLQKHDPTNVFGMVCFPHRLEPLDRDSDIENEVENGVLLPVPAKPLVSDILNQERGAKRRLDDQLDSLSKRRTRELQRLR